MSSKLFFGLAGGYGAEDRSRQSNRRRLVVFLSVFLLLSLIGLIYVFARPAIYRATGQLEFVPATATPGAENADKPYAVRDEVQYLSSTTLLSKVWDDLKNEPGLPDDLRAGDPPATLQSMLSIVQLPNTNIVAIQADGREPVFLPRLIDRVIANYQASLGDRFKSGSVTALAEARDEADKLDAAVRDKRLEVDTYRAQNNIVSTERDENEVLSAVKGVGASLNAANEKVVAAEAKLAALKEAEAAGHTVVRARDNPTLAALEQQASALRADLRATARQFTADYMNIDPRVREMRARLADIEEQMTAQRKQSQEGAIQDAREEVASARAAVAALRQQLVSNQSSVQSFTSRFNEYKTLQDQLAHLEQLHQKATDRLATLDAGERARKPRVEVVEAPSVPQSASSPFYARDALLVLIGALIVALLAMGVVEFFNRPPLQPSTVIVPQTWSPLGATEAMTALPSARSYDALPHARSTEQPTAALPAPRVLPRELNAAELTALLHASDAEFRAIVALLLMGLTAPEVVALRRGDVDRSSGRIHVAGTDERSIVLPPNVLQWLPSNDTDHDAPLFATASGRPLTEAMLDTALLYAAHDAALEAADEVTPESLRHTYIAALVKQGVRFGELAKIVGPLPTDRLSAYRWLAGAAATPAGAVDLVLPALRDYPV
jgi:uncharacterized protein involved in exopolysaccharide biosynthesis